MVVCGVLLVDFVSGSDSVFFSFLRLSESRESRVDMLPCGGMGQATKLRILMKENLDFSQVNLAFAAALIPNLKPL